MSLIQDPYPHPGVCPTCFDEDCPGNEVCVEEARSRAEALAEYPAHKAAQAKQAEQDECPHDEDDHGICLSCGKDIFDDKVAAAEFRSDCLEDR